MSLIKVLIVHNQYKTFGGEDRVVQEEIQLLRKNEVNVSTFFVDNHDIEINGLTNKAKLGFNTVWSLKYYRLLKKKLKDIKPDIVHFHNTFPLISPAAYYACKNLNIPVVQTLHNYRLACPGALFMRSDSICEKCLKGSLLNSIKYGCYRESRVQTIPLTAMLYTHRLMDTWNKKVDKFITLSNFAKNKIIEAGIDRDRIVIKPNFMEKTYLNDSEKEDYIVFVGRLSKEKGVHLLLEGWKNIEPQFDSKLLIIGDGPDNNMLRNKYKNLKNVSFMGRLEKDQILKIVSKAKYLVVPSVWYEGFPMTIVEAYSVNTPVISSDIGSLKEIVVDGITGFNFKNNNINDLEQVLKKALTYTEYRKLENNVMQKFEENYSSDINYKILINIYKEAIKGGDNEK